MNYLEIIGALVGLLYLWLEYKASIYLWIVGVVMPAIYIFVCYQAGLYADVGINIYYLLAVAYGWAFWARGNKRADKQELPIAHIPLRYIAWLVVVFVVTFVGIAYLLIYYTDSDVAWLNSFTTALSIIGMWMLTRKYLEQWWVWVVVDVVSCGLYAYKELTFTAGMYGVYSIIAIFGYFKWKQLMHADGTNRRI